MRPMPQLEVVEMPTSELVEYAGNAKTHPQEQVDQIANSIEQFGNCDPIGVWHNDDGAPEVVEGHGRLMALRKLGIETAPVIYLDHLTDEQRRAYALAHNKLTMNSDFDFEILADELAMLDSFDMGDFGFDIPDLDIQSEPAEIIEDEAPEDAPAVCKTGDIWQLGEHRLMCGDSTSTSDVDKLMNGNHAELLFTSPPYSDMREYRGGKDLEVQNLAKFITRYSQYCSYQAVNLGIKRAEHEIVQYWDDYIEQARNAGLKLLAWNVWDKGHCGSIGQQKAFVPIRHEFIFVFGSTPKELNKTWEKQPEFVAESIIGRRREADGTMTEYSEGDTSNPFKAMESVLLCPPNTGPSSSLHPATFPVKLPYEYIRSFTDEGDSVAEPFGGSGTTLMAAEQLCRKCYLMEIDTHYCDTIIERWQNLTGLNAVKLNG